MKVELDLEITYTVGGTFEIPNELAEQLDFGEVDCRLPLFEWLADHVREEDAMDWKYDITDFNEVEE